MKLVIENRRAMGIVLTGELLSMAAKSVIREARLDALDSSHMDSGCTPRREYKERTFDYF